MTSSNRSLEPGSYERWLLNLWKKKKLDMNMQFHVVDYRLSKEYHLTLQDVSEGIIQLFNRIEKSKFKKKIEQMESDKKDHMLYLEYLARCVALAMEGKRESY